MTTNDDMTPRQPDEDEPVEELFGDALDIVDEAVARITDAEVNEHLRKVLIQSGYTGQLTGLWPPHRIELNYSMDVIASEHRAIADLAATARANAKLSSERLQQAQETLEAARQQAGQILGAARDEADEALKQAAKMVRDAREQSEQIISDARREAEQIITAARDSHANQKRPLKYQVLEPGDPGGGIAVSAPYQTQMSDERSAGNAVYQFYHSSLAEYLLAHSLTYSYGDLGAGEVDLAARAARAESRMHAAITKAQEAVTTQGRKQDRMFSFNIGSLRLFFSDSVDTASLGRETRNDDPITDQGIITQAKYSAFVGNMSEVYPDDSGKTAVAGNNVTYSSAETARAERIVITSWHTKTLEQDIHQDMRLALVGDADRVLIWDPASGHAEPGGSHVRASSHDWQAAAQLLEMLAAHGTMPSGHAGPDKPHARASTNDRQDATCARSLRHADPGWLPDQTSSNAPARQAAAHLLEVLAERGGLDELHELADLLVTLLINLGQEKEAERLIARASDTPVLGGR